MGNNVSRSTSWAAEPIKPTGDLCNETQLNWPHKICNEPANHEGIHCNTKQCGDRIVKIWFDLVMD